MMFGDLVLAYVVTVFQVYCSEVEWGGKLCGTISND